jgi:beta-mannosidase
VDLAGSWKLAPADDDLRRAAIGTDHDDSGWLTATVPGHWRDHPELASSDGPMLYRRAFTMAPPEPGRRRWVTFAGIFYQADVWLDGAYLGDPEGYFVPHAFDITALTRLGEHHVLAIEATCPATTDGPRRAITGVFQEPVGPATSWNPGGIWAPVEVIDTGPVRIDRFRSLCRDADDARAHVLMCARLDSDESRRVRIRTLVDGQAVAETERALAAGRNDLDWTIDVDRPRLWWPRALGEQPLTTITIEVLVDGAPSDAASRRTGLREIAWSRWTCSVNGERLFLKGANLLPTRLDLASATPAEVRRDVELAVDAGLDVLRVHGHIARPEVYEAADELGVLLMQDFPLSGRHARSVRSQAVEQARAAVDLLGHHPSIAMWIAHDDPGDEDGAAADGRPARGFRRVLSHQLPSWNRSVLDRWVKRAIERQDSTRPCVPHSGALPHLPQLDGTDSHLSFGWRTGDVRDLERIARRVPRLVRFVSEFGAQSVPTTPVGIVTSHWPDVDDDDLALRLGAELEVFAQRVPPADSASFEQWRVATQKYQAELVRYHVETLRRLKYRPTGGFCVHALNDPAPAISSSVLDHERVPKAAFHALVRSCAPVIVVADRPPDLAVADERLRLAVHVVNDLRVELTGAVVEVVARWAGGDRTWTFGGDVPADDCVKAGHLELDVPDTLGALTFDLTLTAGDVTATNHYATVVTAVPD